MRIEFYTGLPQASLPLQPGALRPLLERVAGDLDTTLLVVTVGLTTGRGWRGIYHGPQTPAAWPHLRDVAKPPVGLPERFPLVTMVFGAETPFPYQRVDKYGWTWDFASFEAQLATVMSHECFHYGAHQWPDVFPGQDWRSEEQANAWALARARRLGYHVEAEPGRTHAQDVIR
jgi:hypothetical protein